jgi:hypothetical protein
MKYFSKMDNLWGYLQLRVDEDSQDLLTISTPWGYFMFRFLPFGVFTGPGLYQQTMAHDILAEFHLRRNTVVFVDDTTQGGTSARSYLDTLRDLLEVFVSRGVRLKASKCTFGFPTCMFVGHEFSEKGVRLTEDRKQAIVSMATPSTLKELRTFIGAVGYFRNFVPRLGLLLAPLTSMTGGEGDEKARRRAFKWTEAATAAVVEVKEAIGKSEMLYFPEPEGELVLRTDASLEGLGVYLCQIMPDGSERPIWFLSHKFGATERRWSTIEQECFGIVFGILKLAHQLMGRMFVVETDHLNLLFLEKSDVPKLVRWRLRLQEFQFVVRHIPGKENVVADALSRLCVQQIQVAQPVVEWSKEACKSIHNTLVGHHGISKTIEFVERLNPKVQSEWPAFRKDITQFISECGVCQKVKGGAPSQAIALSTTEHHLYAKEPMVAISADTIGPLPKDEEGHQYIIVVICNHLSYAELYAAKSTEAEAFATALVHWSCTYGVPQEIRTDGGTQFTADVIKQLTSFLGVQHTVVVPYRPQANGLVERKCGEVCKHARVLVMEHKLVQKWSRVLPLVKMILNYTVNGSTGIYPAQGLFGSRRDVFRDLIMRVQGSHQEGGVQVLDLKNTIKELDESLTLIIGASQKHTEAQAKLRESRVAIQGRKGDEVLVGDYVLMEYPVKAPHKLSPRYRGPLVVLAKPHPDIWLLGDLITKKELRCHTSRLKKFIVADGVLEHELMDWTMADHDEHVVEAVLEHGYDEGVKQRRKLKLLIQWQGYSSEEATWEWYKNLREVAIVDAYMKEHKL